MAFLQLDFRSGYINSHQEVCVILPDEAPDQGDIRYYGFSTGLTGTAPSGCGSPP